MREKLLEMIEKKGKLPPLPAMIARLQQMIEDPDVGINEVAKVIQTDPVLAGRLIQLANSVFCGSSAFFATGLTRALSRLGLKMAMDIAYSLEMSKVFQENEFIRQEDFWKHSLGLAVISSRLTSQFGGNRDLQSHAYLGGLMKNVGVLVFSHLIPKKYGAFLSTMKERIAEQDIPLKTFRGIGIEKWEEHIFGISNAELGAAFIKRWWPVDAIVIDYVNDRFEVLLAKKSHMVAIGNLFLCVEGISDGVIDFNHELTDAGFQKRFEISEDDYQILRNELQNALEILD